MDTSDQTNLDAPDSGITPSANLSKHGETQRVLASASSAQASPISVHESLLETRSPNSSWRACNVPGFLSKLFLHYFDVHYLDSIVAKGLKDIHHAELRLATRLALISADTVFVPAASYIESESCYAIIRELSDVFELGIVRIVGSGGNLEGFRSEHLDMYRVRSPQAISYRRLNVNDLHPPFFARERSATQDIAADWAGRMGVHVPFITTGMTPRSARSIEENWPHVPNRLGTAAFILPYVQKLLGQPSKRPTTEGRLHRVINEAYFASYTRELRAGIVNDLIFLDAGFQIPAFGPSLPFRTLKHEVKRSGLLQTVQHCTTDQLVLLRDDQTFRNALERAIAADNAREGVDTVQRLFPSGIQSFIVHGHDRATLFELKDYLQNRLGLPEPVILEQQADGGRTIIEKFEESADRIDVAFVLLTPDDAMASGAAARARQNVIFELGYFMRHFGRRSGRVILIQKGEIDIPSDLSGVVYIRITKRIDEAGESIRRELASLGSTP